MSDTPNEQVADNAAIDFSKHQLLNDLSITLRVELGRKTIKIRDLLALSPNSMLELDKLANDPVHVYANDRLIFKGVITTNNGAYCVRLTEIAEDSGKGK